MMEEPRPMDFLNNMFGNAVTVILKDGKIYQGRLKSFDPYINIVLENCEEVS